VLNQLQKSVMQFKKQYGKTPIRSKKCTGCPAWPLALCAACLAENHGERRRAPRAVVYTAERRLGKKY